MKQAVLVVALLFVLIFLFSGGFSVKNQLDPIPTAAPEANQLLGEGDQTNNQKTLQLRNLLFTKVSPGPSTSPNPSTNPSPNPSASSPPNCQTQKVAVDLLLDTSGSMCLPGGSNPCLVNPSGQSKIVALKTAVTQFIGNLNNDDVIGVQEFNTNAANLVTPDLKSNNIGLLNAKISTLGGAGFTYTRDGFEIAKQQIQSRKAAFPDYNWAFIFLSDGVPETETEGRPAESQNPLNTPNLADEIKSMGVRIFSIGLNLDIYSGPGRTYAENLMKNIASSPIDANFYDTPTGAQLTQIYQDIANKICR